LLYILPPRQFFKYIGRADITDKKRPNPTP
jgi:hypothetical protein